MPEYRLKHRDKLLADITTAVCALPPSTRLGDVGVVFEGGDDGPKRMGLTTALEAIADDLTWDEDGSWADATSAAIEAV